MKHWSRILSLVGIAALVFAGGAQAVPGDIVINEIVYDSPGSDVNTWLELKGPAGESLDGLVIVGVNGSNGNDYTTIVLVGSIPADGYFVIAQDPAHPEADLVDSAINLQNGPDSVQLRDVTGAVIDALAYGTFSDTQFPAGEGDPAADVTNEFSLARCPDGADSDDNATDFGIDDTPTPGAENDATCGTPEPTPYTLCEVAADDADGLPVLLNEFVIVTGICISPSGTFSSYSQDIKITDGVCCITVFGGPVDPIAVGDEVEVIGTVAFYNGLTEVSDPNLSVTVISTGNPVPAPTEVTTGDFAANGEDYESCLVKLSCVDFTPTSNPWPEAGSGSVNLEVDDGSGPCAVRIDSDTDIDGTPVPVAPFSLIGVGGQYDSSIPHDSGYQLFPRGSADVIYDDPACASAQGACCFSDGSCTVMAAADCDAAGGVYMGDDVACDPNPCVQPEGACCLPDGSCVLASDADCVANGGTFLGVGIGCDPNPCPTATIESTWGKIKHQFRGDEGR